MSKALKAYCKKFEKNDDRLMTGLFVEGLSYTEIAEKFECKLGTVAKRISKFTPSAAELDAYRRNYARKKLRKIKS